MALQIDKELSTGLVVNYHKIQQIIIQELKATIIITSYKDKEASDEGKHFANSEMVEVDLSNTDNVCPVQYCYLKLKELPEYSEALDV